MGVTESKMVSEAVSKACSDAEKSGKDNIYSMLADTKILDSLHNIWFRLPDSAKRTIDSSMTKKRVSDAQQNDRPQKIRKSSLGPEAAHLESIILRIPNWEQDPLLFFNEDKSKLDLSSFPLEKITAYMRKSTKRTEMDIIRQRLLKVMYHRLSGSMGWTCLNQKRANRVKKTTPNPEFLKWADEGKRIDKICRDIGCIEKLERPDDYFHLGNIFYSLQGVADFKVIELPFKGETRLKQVQWLQARSGFCEVESRRKLDIWAHKISDTIWRAFQVFDQFSEEPSFADNGPDDLNDTRSSNSPFPPTVELPLFTGNGSDDLNNTQPFGPSSHQRHPLTVSQEVNYWGGPTGTLSPGNFNQPYPPNLVQASECPETQHLSSLVLGQNLQNTQCFRVEEQQPLRAQSNTSLSSDELSPISNAPENVYTRPQSDSEIPINMPPMIAPASLHQTRQDNIPNQLLDGVGPGDRQTSTNTNDSLQHYDSIGILETAAANAAYPTVEQMAQINPMNPVSPSMGGAFEVDPINAFYPRIEGASTNDAINAISLCMGGAFEVDPINAFYPRIEGASTNDPINAVSPSMGGLFEVDPMNAFYPSIEGASQADDTNTTYLNMENVAQMNPMSAVGSNMKAYPTSSPVSVYIRIWSNH